MSKLRFRRAILCVIGVVPAIATAGNSPSENKDANIQVAKPVSYSVVYTGRLFGYFRYPEVQTLDRSRCLDSLPNDPLQFPEAYAFLQFRGQAHTDAPLVAVGDNFAPFLLARRVWDPGAAVLQPKEIYDFSSLKYDNVACFLRMAHFAAAVPGEHDFYFGPKYMRDMAAALNAPAVPLPCPPILQLGNCDYQPVRMLGLNLSLKAQRTDAQSDPGSGGSNSKLASKVHVVLPKVVLPWIRSIKVLDIRYLGAPACLSTNANSCDKQIALTINRDEEHPPQGVLDLPARPPLFTERQYYILVTFKGALTEAGTFKIAEPFFHGAERLNQAELVATTSEGEGVGPPWTIVQTNGQNVAFFGVVDPKLGELIGRLNYTWLGLIKGTTRTDRSYETVVNFSDPAEALNQALGMCDLDDTCRTARKVLLAQMSEADVNQNLLPFIHTPDGMAAKIGLVITRGDPDAGTGNGTNTVEPVNGDLRDPMNQPSVLVPGSQFKSPDFQAGTDPPNPYKLNIRLATATVVDDDQQHTRQVSNEVRIRGDAISADPFNHFQGVLAALAGTLRLRDQISQCKNLAQGTPFDSNNNASDLTSQQWQTGLEEISLRVMRRACNSDAALLQHRDVFYSDRLVSPGFSQAGLSAAIGAIFWKGDLIQCMNVPGQTIGNVLQRSADLQRAEDAGQSTDLSRGWPLTVAGITQAKDNGSSEGQKPPWLMRGDLLDVKKLYSVAVTDYLANGDTGYPDLRNAEPQPQVPLADMHFWTLADHLLAELNETNDNPQPASDILDSLDNSSQAPSPSKHDSFLEWARSWGKIDLFPNNPVAGTLNKTSFDLREQKEPTYFFRLYKADFSYSLFQHNLNEGAIPMEFPGLTNPDLSAADSESYTADWQARLQRNGQLWSPYIETDGNWGRRNQRSKSSPFAYQPSQTADAYVVEIGEALNVNPRHQNPSGLRLVLASSMKSQIASPYTQIVPFNGKSSGVPVVAPRNYYWSFRPGLRFEHNFPRKVDSGGGGASQSPTLNSYFESGLQFGEAFHTPSAFQFSNPGASSIPGCTTGLVLIANLVQCVGPGGLASSAQLKTVFANRSFYQQGIYLNFRFDAPLPARSSGEYVVENRGDLLFNRSPDTAVDTRLLDDLKQSLLFPIYGKLTIGPTLEFIFFKTKATGNYYFSYATAVSVNYNFDWHPGLSWRKALGFGTPATAPKPLPTK